MKPVYSSFGMAVNVMREVLVFKIVEHHKYKPFINASVAGIWG